MKKYKVFTTVTTYNFVEIEADSVEEVLANVGELNFYNVKTTLTDHEDKPLVLDAEDWNIKAEVLSDETGETIAKTV